MKKIVSNERMIEIWNNTTLPYGRNYLNPIIPQINQFIIDNNFKGKLLDLGCGYGEKSNIFNQIGFEVTGIDADPQRICNAKNNYSDVNFKQYKFVDKLPFDSNSFDLIFSCSVFQYIEHESIIKECKRILKPNGGIILLENLKNNPITRLGRAYLKLINFKYQSYPYNHFRYKEINSLKKEFKQSAASFYHFLSPFSDFKRARGFFHHLEYLDRILFKFKPIQRYAWLTLFTAINKK